MQSHKIYFMTLLLLFCSVTYYALVSISCNSPINKTTVPAEIMNCKYYAPAMEEISSGNNFITYIGWFDEATNKQLDNEGIPIVIRDGKQYYHPVSIAQTALGFYNKMDDSVNKENFIRICKSLVIHQIIKVDSSGVYSVWPYTRDYYLHNIKDTSNLMIEPWYSAMAQGQIISVLCRGYKITGDSKFITTASNAFQSFYNVYTVDRKDPDWITYVDPDNYLWFEEYPRQQITDISEVNYTLNGFIFSLWGIYDYYQITGRDDVRHVFHSGIATLLHYLPEFRDSKTGLSYYCLRHKLIANRYHKLHIRQLQDLFKQTGIKDFSYWSNKFEEAHLLDQ